MWGWICMACWLGTVPEGPIDFDTQVIPVLTKAGCNSGACHGSAAGRGGFKLSLLGQDPASDHMAIAYELEGRRVDLVKPQESLLLLKPTGFLDHGGGYRLDEEGAGAQILRQWIAQGARRLQLRKLRELDVEPVWHVCRQLPEKVSLRVSARFDDGLQLDVTDWVAVTPEDPEAVQWDDDQRAATVRRAGVHRLLLRYLDRVTAIELIAPFSSDTPSSEVETIEHPVDRFIIERLRLLGLPLSPKADDFVFLRRLHLALLGRLPSPEEVDMLLADRTGDYRRRWVQQLLQSEDFVRFWSYRIGLWWRIRSPGSGQTRDEAASRAMLEWIRHCLERRVPYDSMVREVITATGPTRQTGPAMFHRLAPGPREEAELVSEVFMAARLRCANCHNHPLDQWTQDDYHGLAALFARIRRDVVITVTANGEVTHPRTGQPAMPKIPAGPYLPAGDDGRTAFAEWLTQPDNPYFARAVVNRIWKALMGRGLVEPVDDMRITNQATHPQLLDWLAKDFVEHGCDLRHTIYTIATSQTFQRSSTATNSNMADDRYYSHYLIHPLEAEVLADAIADVSGIAFRFGEVEESSRVVGMSVPDIASRELDVLGRCSREQSCDALSGPQASGLARMLHLLNGGLVNERVTSAEGRLRRWLAEERSPSEIIEEFYRRALVRPPRDEEKAWWMSALDQATSAEEQQAVLEDFLWALLTCREFTTNH
ncbi:MAG: S-layer protein [Pirellulaceae bacterium]|nr:MAG: S-layer protein [Pirellulaceae bacterium]